MSAQALSPGWRWVLAASLAGFLSSFVVADVLALPRWAFVAAWVLAGCAFVAFYATRERVDLRRQFARRWVAGTIGGAVVGALLVRQVLTQDASGRSRGLALAGELAGYGAVYGTVDALMLSVVPVLAMYGARPARDLQQPGGRLRWGLAALLASAVVTAAYHAGFAEFRGAALVQPLVGNAVITLAYLVTGSPVAPVLSHVMMHAAAVLHGMAATTQLPPH
jgi:hypothetical protein